MSVVAEPEITDISRDQPNAPADRQALQKIRPYQGMVAWPTVFLAIGIVGSFAAVCTLGTLGIIPLWLGLILNTLILYADQTPLHEACHGNIAGKNSRYLWLNHLVGYACGTILLHEYKAFRYMHLAHHRETNDPELDPDHWVAVEPVPARLALPDDRADLPPVLLEAHRLPRPHIGHARPDDPHRRHARPLHGAHDRAVGDGLLARSADALAHSAS